MSTAAAGGTSSDRYSRASNLGTSRYMQSQKMSSILGGVFEV